MANKFAAVAPRRFGASSIAEGNRGYMSGFGNGFETEALPGALPVGRNSPQKCPYGLYAEQISGSPFTAPRATNERSWLYRIRPTVCHWGDFKKINSSLWRTAPDTEGQMPVQPMRWDPPAVPDGLQTFVHGVRTMTTAGDASAMAGLATHVYLITQSMEREYFLNTDGELMFVPQEGGLHLATEFGLMDIEPCEIAVIPRGVKFKVALAHGTTAARGYLCENYGSAFTLPERGPIGANCMANQRDFLTPVAAYEDQETPCVMTLKSGGKLWQAKIDQSPLDVVAWHGNYYPYKYDLRHYSPVGPILFDHADPSIFTVMTSASSTVGTANVDFVIFCDRWMVAEDTFRPPWYHMNVMSEFMGLIRGVYDAKPVGFLPGGMSLHNSMLPHGPDADAFERASSKALVPERHRDILAFMFESNLPQKVSAHAATSTDLQANYRNCWNNIRRNFNASRR